MRKYGLPMIYTQDQLSCKELPITHYMLLDFLNNSNQWENKGIFRNNSEIWMNGNQEVLIPLDSSRLDYYRLCLDAGFELGLIEIAYIFHKEKLE